VERNEEKVITSPLVIFEIVFTLETYYQVLRVEIKSLVQPILDLRGLKVDLKDVFESALGLYLKKNISFADAFNACFMKRQGIKEIYSYDEDFDRMGGISRIAPGF